MSDVGMTVADVLLGGFVDDILVGVGCILLGLVVTLLVLLVSSNR